MPIYLQFFNLVIKKSALEEHQINIWDHIHRKPIIEWEDDYLLHATGSMGDYEFEEWIDTLTKAGLEGPNLNNGPRGKWGDFCIIGAGEGLLFHDCDWLDMEFFKFAGAAVRHIDDTSLDIHHSRYEHETGRIDAPKECIVKWINADLVTTKGPFPINLSQNAEIHFINVTDGQKISHKKAPYGAIADVKDGEYVKRGTTVASWYPHTSPILSHFTGKARYIDLIESQSYETSIDDITGLKAFTITEGAEFLNPRLEITTCENGTISTESTLLPIGCMLQINPSDVENTSFDIARGSKIGTMIVEREYDYELIEDYEPWQLSEEYKP